MMSSPKVIAVDDTLSVALHTPTISPRTVHLRGLDPTHVGALRISMSPCAWRERIRGCRDGTLRGQTTTRAYPRLPLHERLQHRRDRAVLRRSATYVKLSREIACDKAQQGPCDSSRSIQRQRLGQASSVVPWQVSVSSMAWVGARLCRSC